MVRHTPRNQNPYSRAVNGDGLLPENLLLRPRGVSDASRSRLPLPRGALRR
jgi:hypothetical protein